MIHKDDAHWNDGEWFDDFELWLRLNYKDKTFFIINEILVYHRVHDNAFFSSGYKEHANELDSLRNKWFR